MTVVEIPDPAVVVMIGASGAGKSTWAAEHYRPEEIVSSDALRGVVGSGRHDLDASDDAFEVLETVVAARTKRRLTVVVDTLGQDAGRRAGYLAAARAAGLPAVAVVFRTAAELARERNRRRDRPVPADALRRQLDAMHGLAAALADEGWDRVVEVSGEAVATDGEEAPGRAEVAGAPAGGGAVTGPDQGSELDLVYQISRFPWGDDPAGWLAEMVASVAESGFAGVALMDHLIQIPQVGRAWDPIPEAHLTLGAIAGLSRAQGRSLRIGALVSPASLRRPGLMAKSIATLDVLTGGRAFCGVGAGWFEREHAAYGLPFGSDRERLDDLERCVETMRALWAPGTKAYAGRTVDLPETTCYPRPVSDVPIIVGGGGERRTLRIAAAWADACNVRGSEDQVAAKIDVLRRHCADVGRDPADVAVTVLDLPVVGRDRSEVADLVELHRGRRSAADFAAQYPTGTAEQHVARYRRLAALGVSTVFVAPFGSGGPADVERFAPITTALRRSA